MQFKFYIVYKLLKLLVSLENNNISVKVVKPCSYNEDFCQILAETNELLAFINLFRLKQEGDIYVKAKQHFTDAGWTIEEYSESPENAQG